MAKQRLQDDGAPAPVSVEHALSHWVRLTSRFIEMGETMADAMSAASRIVAFAGTGPLVDGQNETRRSAPPQSGVLRRITR